MIEISDGAGDEGHLSGTFEDFYRSEFRPLVAFLILRGASSAEAEDVAQEVLTQAYRAWGSITHPHAWVRVVAWRLLLRLRAREVRNARRELDAMEGPSDANLADPSERYEVLNLLSTLPHQQRAVMAYMMDGFGPNEIADVLSMSPATVRSHLRFARRRLADFLARRQAAQV